MTRYTNVGIKRSYIEAGFGDVETAGEESTSAGTVPDNPEPAADPSTSATSDSPKKKRKHARTKKSHKNDSKAGEPPAESRGENENVTDTAIVTAVPKTADAKDTKHKLKNKRKKDAAARKLASERRRLTRQQARYADTICFACRQTGHAAKHCPQTLAGNPMDTSKEGSNKTVARSVVGICYRCGSKKHTLAKCKAQANPENPLLFASCFVCSGKGHLASACPQNKEKGVYPNGGNCKLCGETTHLAKDCHLRKKDATASTAIFGTGREAGADEDDFHTFKRKTTEVAKDEKAEEKLKKMQNIKVGAHSGVVKRFGVTPTAKPKKVVTF